MLIITRRKKGERRAKEEEEDDKAKVGKWAGEVKRQIDFFNDYKRRKGKCYINNFQKDFSKKWRNGTKKQEKKLKDS